MPLSQKQLQLLRRKVPGAEDVPIDMDVMASMTAQEAMQYFMHGGKVVDSSEDAVRVERLPETQVDVEKHRGSCSTSASSGFDVPKRSASASAEVSDDDDDDAPVVAPNRMQPDLPANLDPEHQSMAEQEWRKQYAKRSAKLPIRPDMANLRITSQVPFHKLSVAEQIERRRQEREEVESSEEESSDDDGPVIQEVAPEVD